MQIVTTVAERAQAEQIAQQLVERGLAACVQIGGPITSVYRWQGVIETSTEWQCVLKTRADLFAQVEAAIRALHPYEVPEILATPILAGHEPYLRWLDAQLIR